MIDLHLHTTASDGRLTARELVTRAAAARLAVMAVTDHDTTASVAEARGYAEAVGVALITGIEITAIDTGSDVHILGYFMDPGHAGLATFLSQQRDSRIARVEAIADRLAALGVPIDIKTLLIEAQTQSGRSVGRPQVARAMVIAGHVRDVREAFDRWLGEGLPAFIRREGAPSETVIDVIHQAGGIASVAHPGKSIPDERLSVLCNAGLDALEAFHPDHDGARTAHYVRLAAALGLLVTGGSDFHGDPDHGWAIGAVGLPPADWRRLSDARHRHARG